MINGKPPSRQKSAGRSISKPRQQLIYELADGAVLVKPQPETLKDLYGCLADGRSSASKSEEREAVRRARAARHE